MDSWELSPIYTESHDPQDGSREVHFGGGRGAKIGPCERDAKGQVQVENGCRKCQGRPARGGAQNGGSLARELKKG
jgi:hypothetical protein